MKLYSKLLAIMRYLFICTCLIYKCLNVQSTDEKILKLVVLKDRGQDNVVEWFQNSLQSDNSAIQFASTVVELSGDKEDEMTICNLLRMEGIAMVDLTWSGNEYAEKVALLLGIPYVQIDVSISPSLLMLDTYLQYRKSSDVALIFDDPEKVDEALYFWIDTSFLRMVVSENLDETSANRIKSIRPIPNNFALVASTNNMTLLFQKALEENLTKLEERWNLVFLDFNYEQFDRTLIDATKVNILYLNKDICCKFLQTDPCDCPSNFNLPQNFLKLAITSLKKIIIAMNDEDLELTEKIQCDNLHYNNQSKHRFDELLRQEVDANNLLESGELLYKLRLEARGTIEMGFNGSTVEPVANYTSKEGVMVLEGKIIKPIKQFFRVGITHALPWAYKETDSSGRTFWTGYCVDFAHALAEVMNYDFEFVEPVNGTFGKKNNGVFDGIVGDLARGETDLAITALIMTADREEFIDFVAPYFEQTGISIVMRKPVRKTSLFKFMTVLKLEVWLSIVGALIMTGFTIWFLDKYSPYSARNNKKAYPYPCRDFTLKESFWFALTSFTPQGGGEAPKALSGRTLVAAYWLFVVLMLATFTANLAAFLTVERMQTPVQSLEQLAKQSRINYTVVKDSNTHTYFINMKNAEDTLYRMWKELTLNASIDDTQYRVWDYPIREQYGHILLAINDSNPVANASEGFRLVDEHTDADFAFIHDSSEIKYEISRNCNLTEVGEIFAEKPYAVAVQQGSHLQDEISKAILNFQKDRYFEQLQSKYWDHSAKGNCPTTDDTEGITLESLGGVFIATLFGLGLAMVTLAGEVIYYRRKRKIKGTEVGKIINVESPGFKAKLEKSKLEKPSITIGTEFKPVNYKDISVPDLAPISLYPKSRGRKFHN